MAKSSTSFGTENQPKKRTPRGKSERTKILESFGRLSRTEEEFYDLLTEKAFNPEDQFSFKELLSRISPIPKAVAPFVKFELDPDKNLHEQSAQILVAISKGEIPPDIGNSIISNMAHIVKVKEVTDMDERLKAMEAHVDSQE